MTNPLVSERKDSTEAFSGVAIAESVDDTKKAIESGDWAAGALGIAGTALDAIGMAMDPFGAALSAGVGWLIEHVGPVSDALDSLTGDPDEIKAHADTWKNVHTELADIAAELTRLVDKDTANWTGTAGDTYRARSADTATLLKAAHQAAEGAANGITTAGEIVGGVRTLVRDIIAELIGHLISWALQVAATLGIGLTWVVPQVVAEVAKVAANIAEYTTKLVDAFKKLSPLLDSLGSSFSDASKALKNIKADNASPAPTTSQSAKGLTDPGGGGKPGPAPAVPGGPAQTSSSSAGPDLGNAPPPKTDDSKGNAPHDGPSQTTSSNAGPSSADPGGNRPKNPNDTAAPTASSSAGDRGIKNSNTSPRSNDTPTAGRVGCGDPIDVSTGRVMLTQTDVELGGVLPLLLERTHLSSYRLGRAFGPSWASTVDQRLEFDAEGAYLAAEDGTLLTFPVPAVDVEVLPRTGPQWPLTRADDGSYVLTQPDKERILFFDRDAGHLTGIADDYGNWIRLAYAPNGVLVELTHSAGHHVGVHSADGRIISFTLLSGGPPVELIHYRYDVAGRLTEVINSSGKPLTFEYDGEGRLARWIDRNGMWYRYFYDAAGRCTRTDGAGGQLNYTLTYADGRTTATDSLGNSTVYELNSALQVIAQTDPLGNVTRTEWDDRDRLLTSTDALGHSTRYRYDNRGNLVTVVRADGAETVTEYDDRNRPVRVVEPDGGVWMREYTTAGDLAAIVDPLGARTAFSYAARGRPSSATDALGNLTRYEYNAAGMVVAVTDALGATTRYSYDRFGRSETETDPLGARTRSSWTVEGAPLAQVWPDGSVERRVHDAEGNLRETVSAQNLVTRTDYTFFDRPSSRTAADGTKIELAYDTESRVTAITNEQGLAWRYRYNASGRLAGEVDFNGSERRYSYDAAGRLSEQVNDAGQAVRISRDLLGRVVRREVDGAITTYTYDLSGRLTYARNPHAELAFTYDALGQVLSETVNGATLSSAYDALGRRIRRVTPTGAVSTWNYDPAGRPVALSTAGHSLRFRFDAANREIERRIGDGAAVRHVWDARDRLVAQTLLAGPSGQVAGHREFRYRQDGALISVDDPHSGRRSYELDPVGQVTAVKGAGWNEHYAYDGAGNLTQPNSRVYQGTLLMRDTTAQYSYDAAARLVTRRTAAGAWHYVWDGEDRLVSVDTPNGQRWHYRYDPLGRRIAKQLIGDGSTVLAQTTFAWDGAQLAEEISNGVRALEWNWEPGTDRVLTQTERVLQQDSRQWAEHRFHAVVTDLVGAPTEFVGADGVMAWRGHLSLWGHANEQMPTPLRFPGQYNDQETGLHYNFYRYYDPVAARYMTPDPLGVEPAPNVYSYVRNPTSSIDPLGLAPCKLSFDEAHSNPPGPSVRVRGPRTSHAGDRTPNQVEDKNTWDEITQKSGMPNPHKERLSYHQDPQTLSETHPGLGNQLHPLGQGMTATQAIEHMGRNDPKTKDYWEQQDRRNEHTANMSVERANNSQSNPKLDADVDNRLGSVTNYRQGAQALLQNNDGFVIGSGHGDNPSWRFFQDNMEQLKDAGVNKLYLESLRDDAFGAHVKEFLDSPPSTQMHSELKTFLDHPNNAGMRDTIMRAKEVGGMDIVGVGGNPAQRPNGPDAMHQRHAMLNSYATEAVEHHQATNPGKYVMENGTTHAQTHTWSGTPVQVGQVALPNNSPGTGQLLGVPAVTPEGGRFARLP